MVLAIIMMPRDMHYVSRMMKIDVRRHELVRD